MDFPEIYDTGDSGISSTAGSSGGMAWPTEQAVLMPSSSVLPVFSDVNGHLDPLVEPTQICVEYVGEPNIMVPLEETCTENDVSSNIAGTIHDCSGYDWTTSTRTPEVSNDFGLAEIKTEMEEIKTEPAGEEENILYSVVLPELNHTNSDNQNSSSLDFPSFENMPLVNFELNFENPNNCFVVPTSQATVAIPNDGASVSSGISVGDSNSSPSQYSDDRNFSPDNAEGVDEGICLNTEEPPAVDHEETVSSTGLLHYESKPIPDLEEGCSYVLELQMVDCKTPNLMDTFFTNEEFGEVFDVVDGQGTSYEIVGPDNKTFIYSPVEGTSESTLESQQLSAEPGSGAAEGSIVFCEDYDQPDVSETASYIESGNHEWAANEKMPSTVTSSVTKKRKYTRRKSRPSNDYDVDAQVQDNPKISPRNSKRSQRRSTKEPTKMPRIFDEIEDLNWSIPKVPVPPASRVTPHGGRPRVDVTSFRFKMGPHLRTLAAILEITGMKRVSDFVPYDVIRRFHPTDLYRTIDKSIESLAAWGKSDTDDVEPDWEQMEKYTERINWNAHDGETDGIKTMKSSSESRVYYKSPFGFQEAGPHCVVSLRQELEVNGKLTSAPDVLSGVGSAQLNIPLNLHTVAENCANTEFQEDGGNFGPLLMRLKEPKCAGLLYESGRLLVIGTKSFGQFRIAARKFARMVQKTGANVRLNCLKMHFYIGLVKLPFDINIEALKRHEYLSKFMLSDSTFSGVVIQMKDSPILCVVFNTGAILMTEATSQGQMKDALDKIYPSLRLFGYQR